jgi:hypothetical protein
MLGDEEKLMGYEGLQVIIYLSSKRMIPFVEIHYLQKAPVFTKVDDVMDKLKKHYGTLYTDKSEFAAKVLAEEKEMAMPGEVYEC